MKHIFRRKLPAVLFSLLLSAGVQAQKVVKRFIKKYEQLAIESMQKHSIPASIILGVSIVESAAGESAIAKAFRNFFGVKGSNTGSQAKLGYKSAYKEYPTDAASFEHFCQILMNKKFYVKMKSCADYKQWLKAMNAASYAEAKQKWVADITRTIDKFELYKLDNPTFAVN
ncbi:glucosaminidase domain-containing protein [Flavisolibacter nicotianae]|uniref:glucosaminidase domain-containing protein n=1 Tax=Flavisolibacter nicotianae TaxID=2364882 RepID=UPI000EAF4B0D|nr:glucosaminidase domain-containing protein [Flavisolibacter nicotianae]